MDAVKARDFVWLGLLIAVAALLRLPGLGGGLWRDEGSTYFDATARTLAGALHEIRLAELNPPGYFLLMRAWLALAGTDDVAMKIPAFVCGVAVVAATFALGIAAGSRPAAWIAATFAALAAQGIDLSTDARPYTCAALLAAFVAAAACSIVRAPEGRAPRGAYVRYGLVAIVLGYVQYTGALLAGGLVAGACCAGLAGPRRGMPMAFIGVNAIVGVAWLPLVPALLDAQRIQPAWLDPLTASALPGRVIEEMGFAVPIDFMRLQITPVLLAVFAVALLRRRAGVVTITGGVAVAFALTVEASAGLREPRYAYVYTPIVDVLLALALVALARACGAAFVRRPGGGFGLFAPIAVAVLSVGCVQGAPSQVRAWQRVVSPADRSGIRRLVAATGTGPGRTLVVVVPDYLGPSLGYYARGRRDIDVMGIPHAQQPEHFRCCEDAWSRPSFVDEAERAIRVRARAYDRVVIAYDPDAANRGTVAFARTADLLARLERDFPARGIRRFDGRLEPVASVTIDVKRGRRSAAWPHVR